MSETKKITIPTVSRDSACPQNGGRGHIPTTMDRVVRGQHVKLHVCKYCGSVIS